MKNPLEFIAAEKERHLSTLFEFLRIPSVSADPGYREPLLQSAAWLERLLSELGFRAETIPTSGNPLVYAESPPVPDAPVLLFYGHYDVQPPDPIGLWDTSPFEPTVRNGNVYARGATDDKGQLLTHVFAAEAIMKNRDNPGIQLKFLFEGEEESVGSVSLYEFLEKEEHRRKIACDCVVVSDSSMFGENQPAVTYGLRGIVAFELFLEGPSRDLHSGDFGGTVMNPGIALSNMLSSVVDENGVVRIPDFYKDVRPITDKEKEEYEKLPFDENEFFGKIGLKPNECFGEKGFTTLQRRWARPTFDINGITCGYQGEGGKTIIPSKASAKFTFRMVPDQNPEDIVKHVRNWFEKQLPPGITMELKFGHAAPGMLVSLESPYLQKATAALRETFGTEPVFTRQGGSIPIVAELRDRLAADVLLLGWGQDNDNLHAPNEKFSLENFRRGMIASARLMTAVATQRR